MAYLKCECGEDLFVKTIKLKTTMGGGVVEEVAGWRCLACRNKAESGELLKRLQIEEKEKEIARLQQEVDDGKKTRKATGKQEQVQGNRTEAGPPDISA